MRHGQLHKIKIYPRYHCYRCCCTLVLVSVCCDRSSLSFFFDHIFQSLQGIPRCSFYNVSRLTYSRLAHIRIWRHDQFLVWSLVVLQILHSLGRDWFRPILFDSSSFASWSSSNKNFCFVFACIHAPANGCWDALKYARFCCIISLSQYLALTSSISLLIFSLTSILTSRVSSLCTPLLGSDGLNMGNGEFSKPLR